MTNSDWYKRAVPLILDGYINIYFNSNDQWALSCNAETTCEDCEVEHICTPLSDIIPNINEFKQLHPEVFI